MSLVVGLLGFVRSRVMILGPDDELREAVQGTEFRVMHRLELGVASSVDGFGWLCSPSYVATKID